MCYLLDNLEQDISLLSSSGFVQIDVSAPAPALGIAWSAFMGPQIGIVEVLENSMT